MNEYDLGQTVYYVEFVANVPMLVSFLIVAIRQTDSGYEYSKYLDAASPYIKEANLFPTEEEAVNYQIAVLEGLLPTP